MMFKILILIPLLLQLGCLGCESQADGEKLGKASIMAENLEKWKSVKQNYPGQSYELKLSIACFCAGPQSFVVNFNSDDVLLTYVALDEEGNVIADYVKDEWDVFSVAELFAVAEKANNEAWLLRISYHHEFGLPVEIDIDWNGSFYDDEIIYYVNEVNFIK